MTKKGRLFFIFLLVMALSLPLQAAPLIGTYESPGDFIAGDWKELLYGGGEGQVGNEIQAVSLPFYLFAGATLQTVESLGVGDCGESAEQARRYKTIYSGGTLTLGNIAGNPWYNTADSHTRFQVTLDPTEVTTCKYVEPDGTTETGEISFQLKSTGTVLNNPGYAARIEATYRGEPLVTPPTTADPATISGTLDGAKITITGPVAAIDIKPGSCPNPINIRSRGVLPVAILGSADFNVRTIDPSTIRMLVGMNDGIAPVRWNYEDVATPYVPPAFPGERFNCNNLGPDGFEDLNLKFRTQDLVQALGDLGDEKRIILTLEFSFKLLDGTELQGEDVVVIINNKKK